jgi:hypothetical protein
MNYNALTTTALTRVWLQTTDRRMPLRAIWLAAAPSTPNATPEIGGNVLCA